jgi:hypothetical protein
MGGRKNILTEIFMLRLLKSFGWLALLVLGFQSAQSSSFLGPPETFETSAFGYSRLTTIEYPGSIWSILSPDFTFAPHNLGEEFRWSTPIIYYTYDASFVDYFGTNGIAAVDSAFALLNAAFSTNMSGYSANLSECPLSEARVNHTAAAMHLFDLKSAALELMVPRLGLADPERWTWCLRDRVAIPGLSCPFFDFDVIQRNFDPVDLTPSKYVNGVLFTYQWLQYCGTFDDRSDPLEVAVDPLDTYQTAVATPKITFPDTSYYGWFHTWLTRDDIGALRYLYETNNVNYEASAPDALLFNTNTQPQLLFTSNLTLFASQALTNSAANLIALYPGLVDTSILVSNGLVMTTNVIGYYTNAPWGAPGTLALGWMTNVTFSIVSYFHHTFGNVYIVTNSAQGVVVAPLTTIPTPNGYAVAAIQNISVTNGVPPFSIPGTFSLITNTSTRLFLTNIVIGDFFIATTNFTCGASILGPPVVSYPAPFTNVLASTTNTSLTGSTNTTGNATNAQSFTRNLIILATNRIFEVYPIECLSNSIALRQGLDRLVFVRRDYDSLVGRFFNPVITNYSRVAFTNNALVREYYQRTVTRPDILITAADITAAPGVDTVVHPGTLPANFNSTAAITGLSGPGTIEGPFTLTFNKTGPVRLNTGDAFVDEESAIFFFNWGSFDSSTNAPIVYGGNSLLDIQNQLLIEISPTSLPAGSIGSSYASGPLTVTGGQPPYAWTVSPNSPGGLPSGLTLTSSNTQAAIAGTPDTPGTYDILIRVTDAGARYVEMNYALVINP